MHPHSSFAFVCKDGKIVRSRRSVPSADIVSPTMSLAFSAEGQYLLAHLDSLNDSIDGGSIATSTRGQLPFDAEPILDDPSLSSIVVAAAMCVYIVAPTMM